MIPKRGINPKTEFTNIMEDFGLTSAQVDRAWNKASRVNRLSKPEAACQFIKTKNQ